LTLGRYQSLFFMRERRGGLHVHRSETAMGDGAAYSAGERLNMSDKNLLNPMFETHKSRIERDARELLGLAGCDLLKGTIQLRRAGGLWRSYGSHLE
jgi:hypothetical protein